MSRGPSQRRSFLASVVGGALTGGGALMLVGAVSAQPAPQPPAEQEAAPAASPPGPAPCPRSPGDAAAAAAESEADRLIREYVESFAGCIETPTARAPATQGFSRPPILDGGGAPATAGRRARSPAPGAAGRFRPCRADSDSGQVQDPRCRR